MKRTNSVTDALNTNKALVDVGDGIVIPLPVDGVFGGERGPAGVGVPAGGTSGQVVQKTAAGTMWATPSKELVGLAKVDNTADSEKPLSEPQALALTNKADLLDGKVPSSQLPTGALIGDATVAQVINEPVTGAAIDARINTQVAPQVQQITAEFIAGDRAVVDAAAAAVNTNPKIAELESKNAQQDSRFNTIEPAVPFFQNVENVLFAISDEAGSETWLGARASDGGPTNWAMEHVRTRLGIESNTDTEYLYAVADKDGRATDLSVRLSDGQVPDWVLARWAKRLALSLGTGGFLPSDRYVRDGELLPVTTDMTRMAGWGSSSMQGFGARLAAPVGVSYINGGKAGEQSQHIAARLGSRPALLTFPGNQIPASGATTVTSSNVTPNVSMLTFSGTVAGVHGSLSHVDGAHVFTRTTAGTSATATPDAPFLPDLGLASRDAVTLLWMGKNDFTRFDDGTEKTVIERTDTAFDWLAPMTKRVLVLGHFVDDVTPVGTVERKQIYATNAAHAARYGDLFVDIDKFLTTDQVWSMTGMTPTAADLEAQATGNKPPSLSNDAQHLNTAGYEAVKMLLIQRFNQLGWYSTTTA